MLIHITYRMKSVREMRNFTKKKKEEELGGRRCMFVTPTNILCIHNDPYL